MTLSTLNATRTRFTTGMDEGICLADCTNDSMVSDFVADCPSNVSHWATAQPSIETAISAICQDARRHSLRYVLRNNVGHDGE